MFKKSRLFWRKLGNEAVGIVEAQGQSGGIWVLSSDLSMTVSVLDIHQQVVTLMLKKGSCTFFYSAVYASHTLVIRDRLWDQLVVLRDLVNHPLIVISDFNEITMPFEVQGGVFFPNHATKFLDSLNSYGLLDL